MALTDSELYRIKHELGYHLLTSSAEPFIGFVSRFDQIIKENVQSGAATTSSTSVTAATSPTPVALTLSDATGFATGQRIVVDVDERREVATAQSLSGSSLTMQLAKAHSGTYPVAVESGETIVRGLLGRIAKVKDEMSNIYGEGALKKVDEIEFYDTGRALFGSTADALMWWREQLASAIGTASVWSMQRAGAQRLAVY